MARSSAEVVMLALPGSLRVVELWVRVRAPANLDESENTGGYVVKGGDGGGAGDADVIGEGGTDVTSGRRGDICLGGEV